MATDKSIDVGDTFDQTVIDDNDEIVYTPVIAVSYVDILKV